MPTTSAASARMVAMQTSSTGSLVNLDMAVSGGETEARRLRCPLRCDRLYSATDHWHVQPALIVVAASLSHPRSPFVAAFSPPAPLEHLLVAQVSVADTQVQPYHAAYPVCAERGHIYSRRPTRCTLSWRRTTSVSVRPTTLSHAIHTARRWCLNLGCRLSVCREFIQALDACHANNWAKWTGGCNQAKNDLNMCLRKEVSPEYR